MNDRSSLAPTVLLAAALALTALVYWPGLRGPFMFDDIYTIRDNELIAIERIELAQLRQAFLASHFEFPHSRPLSMLSFGLNHLAGGYETFGYKLTNLLIHLAAGLAVFLLTRLLLRALTRRGAEPWSEGRLGAVSAAVAAIWLLHPLNLTPVLYVVQRMASLSSLFLFCGLALYASGRARMQEGSGGLGRVLAALLVFGPLAFLCKETGLLLPLLMLVVELCFFRFEAAQVSQRRALYLFFGLTLALPAALAGLYLLLHPEWITGGYAARAFTLEERVLTQARALWFYLSLLFYPAPDRFGFFHDDFAMSRGLLEPWTTLPALAGIAALLLFGLFARRRAPVLSFAVLFFLCGHLLESSIIALEPIYEHRNYLPSYGVVFALVYYLASPALFRAMRPARVAFPLAICGLLALITAGRAQLWAEEETLYLSQVANHPDSPRANFKAGAMMIDKLYQSSGEERKRYYAAARYFLERVSELSPTATDGLFGLVVLHLTTRLEVPREWIEELERRLETTPFSGQTVTMGQFTYLVKCRLSGYCDLDGETIEAIFDAALRNPTLHYTARAGLYTAYMGYAARYLRDYGRALDYARRAADAWPARVTYRLQLVKLLVELGRPEEARTELEKARQLDPNGRFADVIARVEKQLAEKETEGGGPLAGQPRTTRARGASAGSAGPGS